MLRLNYYIAQEKQKIFESTNSKPDVALIVSYSYITDGCNIFLHLVDHFFCVYTSHFRNCSIFEPRHEISNKAK